MTPTGTTPTGMTATRMCSTEWAGVGNRDVVFVIQGLTFLSQKKKKNLFFFLVFLPNYPSSQKGSFDVFREDAFTIYRPV